MAAYYNEHDAGAAAWLRELIRRGLIAGGDVDERSIADVSVDDVRGYTQVHLFAGIGGWSRALRLAGWPDDRPVWTGSPPCQSFSAAGKRKGGNDERHLWPEMLRILREYRPDTAFMEQVAAAIGFDWLDAVSLDLESAGYAVGPVVLPAASVGAPHIRQRLWIVADRAGARLQRDAGAGIQRGGVRSECDGAASVVAQPRQQRAGRDTGSGDRAQAQSVGEARAGGRAEGDASVACGAASILGLPASSRCERERHEPEHGEPVSAGEKSSGAALPDRERREGQGLHLRPGRQEQAETEQFWSACDWIPCIDGKARPVEPGTEPLVDGIQSALDSVFSIQEQAWKEIDDYARRSPAETDADQVLQMVREGVLAQACGEKDATGMRVEFHAPEVLLDLLRGAESACDGAAYGRGSKKASAEVIEGAMRSVRRDERVVRASCQRGSERQQLLQPPATLHELSLVLAWHAEAYREKAIAAHAAFNRILILRGAGNAIVPQVAAEVIRAYMEA